MMITPTIMSMNMPMAPMLMRARLSATEWRPDMPASSAIEASAVTEPASAEAHEEAAREELAPDEFTHEEDARENAAHADDAPHAWPRR